MASESDETKVEMVIDDASKDSDEKKIEEQAQDEKHKKVDSPTKTKDEDVEVEDEDSSTENDQNLQNEGSPEKSKKGSKTKKRKSSQNYEVKGKKKASQSSPKKKKVSESMEVDEAETEKNAEKSEDDEKTDCKGEETDEKKDIKNDSEKSDSKEEETDEKKDIKKESEQIDSKEEETDEKKDIKKESEQSDSKEEETDEKKDTEDEVADEISKISKKEDLTSYFEKKDHSVNQVYQSEIPQVCKDEPCQLGVDEAGRGPVLGPMVYGISYAPLSQKQLLVNLGCADSKSLTEEKRDVIFDKICDNNDKMGWAVDAISPNYIANCMYKRCKTSLNEVSMNSAIDLIKRTIEAGVHVAEIYVDTVGKPEKYQAKLEFIFPGIKITVAKKADSTYPIVSAASICAKVSRDHALRAWQFREGDNETSYGSGYPNDPVTKAWLADNVDVIFGFPQIVRFSWSTAEKVLAEKALTVEWEDPEEASPPPVVVTAKISSFFAASPSKKSERKRHKFFTGRCLSSTTAL